MNSELYEILIEVNPSIGKYNGNKMVSDGVLESIDIMEIVNELEEKYDVTIPARYIIPEYFESIDSLINLVNDVKKSN